MILYATFKSNSNAFTVEFIEVRLKNGTVVALNWDESGVQYTKNGCNTRYKGVLFNEEYANGRISELKGCKVVGMEIYTEEPTPISVKLQDMYFTDGEETLLVKPKFKRYLYKI